MNDCFNFYIYLSCSLILLVDQLSQSYICSLFFFYLLSLPYISYAFFLKAISLFSRACFKCSIWDIPLCTYYCNWTNYYYFSSSFILFQQFSSAIFWTNDFKSLFFIMYSSPLNQGQLLQQHFYETALQSNDSPLFFLLLEMILLRMISTTLFCQFINFNYNLGAIIRLVIQLMKLKTFTQAYFLIKNNESYSHSLVKRAKAVINGGLILGVSIYAWYANRLYATEYVV